jgi:hypothetical protein
VNAEIATRIGFLSLVYLTIFLTYLAKHDESLEDVIDKDMYVELAKWMRIKYGICRENNL